MQAWNQTQAAPPMPCTHAHPHTLTLRMRAYLGARCVHANCIDTAGASVRTLWWRAHLRYGSQKRRVLGDSLSSTGSQKLSALCLRSCEFSLPGRGALLRPAGLKSPACSSAGVEPNCRGGGSIPAPPQMRMVARPLAPGRPLLPPAQPPLGPSSPGH